MNFDIKHTVFTTDGRMTVGMGHQGSYNSTGARLYLAKVYDSEGNLLADYSNCEKEVVAYDIPMRNIKSVEMTSPRFKEAYQAAILKIEVDY